MKHKVTLAERIGLFVLWPVLAPAILILMALLFVAVWPAILFIDNVTIDS